MKLFTMKCWLVFLGVVVTGHAPGKATAATIFESGTLGPTGVPISDLVNGTIPGTVVDSSVFVGVKFQLNQPVITSQITGHFVERVPGTFFGAIVELDDEKDIPDSIDFSTPDFLGSTLLTFPNPSAEVFGDLNLALDLGWYALVFGSGLFGADGGGIAVRNGADTGSPIYIAAQPFSGVSVWFDATSDIPNHRFVIDGRIVPEASSIALASIAFLIILYRRKSCQANS